MLPICLFIISLNLLTISVTSCLSFGNSRVRPNILQFKTWHFIFTAKSILVWSNSVAIAIVCNVLLLFYYVFTLVTSRVMTLNRIKLLNFINLEDLFGFTMCWILICLYGCKSLSLLCSCARLTLEASLTIVLHRGILLVSFLLQRWHTLAPRVVKVRLIVCATCVAKLVKRLCLGRSDGSVAALDDYSILTLANSLLCDAHWFGSLLRIDALELANRRLCSLINWEALDFFDLWAASRWPWNCNTRDTCISKWLVLLLINRGVLLDCIHVLGLNVPLWIPWSISLLLTAKNSS